MRAYVNCRTIEADILYGWHLSDKLWGTCSSVPIDRRLYLLHINSQGKQIKSLPTVTYHALEHG